MIYIEFNDGCKATLRDPKRKERIAGFKVYGDWQAIPEKGAFEKFAPIIEAADAVLCQLVVSVMLPDGTELQGEAAEEYAREQGWFLVAEGVAWLGLITFRDSGRLAATNGDLGLGSEAIRPATESEGEPSPQVLDAGVSGLGTEPTV